MLNKLSGLKVERLRMKGWISHEQLKKIVVFTKPKEKCVEVMIEFVPIRRGKNV